MDRFSDVEKTANFPSQIMKDQVLVNGVILIKWIGSGDFGRVYKAREIDTGKIIAVKMIRFKEEEKYIVLQEARIQIKLIHENIVRLFKFYVRENNLIMHLEYFDGLSLFKFIVSGQIEGQKYCIKRRIINGLKSGVAYLHNRNILHGDLHYANVMVNCHGEVKLIDFGCAEVDAFNKSYDTEMLEKIYETILGAKPFPDETSDRAHTT